MKTPDITHCRLDNLHVSNHKFRTIEDVVAHLGAVQAQDYAAAKWAIGLRLPGITDQDIEKAFNEGAILRTHIMRPTWHFVVPGDMLWMQELTAPRVIAASSAANRTLELNEAVFKRSNKAIAKALKGGNMLTRTELGAVLQKVGITTNDLRLVHLMMRAELDGVICSGPRVGKQFTYALFEERVPGARSMKRNDSIAELARRYFTSHGPATLADFVWWSGLTLADAKAGIEMVGPEFISEVVDGQTYWLPSATPTAKAKPGVYLLPNYDEYIIAYKDRSAMFDPQQSRKADLRDNVIFNNTIIVNGRVEGTWKRTIKKDKVEIIANPFIKFSKATQKELLSAANNYGKFLGLPAILK